MIYISLTNVVFIIKKIKRYFLKINRRNVKRHIIKNFFSIPYCKNNFPYCKKRNNKKYNKNTLKEIK